MAKLVMAQHNKLKAWVSCSLDMHARDSSFPASFSCLMAACILHINIRAIFSGHHLIFLPDQHKLASNATELNV